MLQHRTDLPIGYGIRKFCFQRHRAIMSQMSIFFRIRFPTTISAKSLAYMHFGYAFKKDGAKNYTFYCPDKQVWEELGYFRRRAGGSLWPKEKKKDYQKVLVELFS